MSGNPIKDFKYLAVMAGQSNASPEHATALRAAAKGKGMAPYTVGQVWHGGTNLKEWLGAAHGGANEFFNDDFFNVGGTAYLQTLLANPINAGLPIVLHWFQGENDASGLDDPNLYAARLEALLTRFAAGCATAGRSWYLVMYGVWHGVNGGTSSFTTVRAAQQAAVTARTNAIYIETSGYARPDGVHIAEYNTIAAATVAALIPFLPKR